MQALFTTGERERPLEWQDTPRPELQNPTDALVHPLAVAACDLDRSIVSGHSPFPGRFPLGHEFTGVVTALGEAVSGLKPGDTVLASFQPSCGSCPRCHQRHSSVCNSVPNGTMYGIGPTGGDWGGAVSELVRVPWADFNLIKVPPQIDAVKIASGSDNLADGLRGVDAPLQRNPNASVLIAGRGSIPLYAVVCAQHFSAGSISVASDDSYVLETAESMGVECLPVTKWPKRFRSHDITVDCTNTVDGLSCVLQSTSPYGECTSSSIFFGPTTPIPMFNLNMRGISFHTGRVNSAAQLSRVLELLQEGLDPERINPAYWSFDQAVEALTTEPFSRKVIVHR